MQLNKQWTILLAFFLSAFVLTAHAQSTDPVNMLQSVSNNVISGLRANQATLKTKPEIVYNLAYRYVVPHADLAAMSKRVVPPQIWNKATASQREQFQKEFTITLIRTYASALTSYKDQVVKFYPVRGGIQGNTIEVASNISGSNGRSIRVNYRLIRSGDSWRVFDLSVEGVSMLESFRSQFSTLLAQGSMADLLQRMAGHNKR